MWEINVLFNDTDNCRYYIKPEIGLLGGIPLDKGNLLYLRGEKCVCSNFSTTNITWISLESNNDFFTDMPEAIHSSHGTRHDEVKVKLM